MDQCEEYMAVRCQPVNPDWPLERHITHRVEPQNRPVLKFRPWRNNGELVWDCAGIEGRTRPNRKTVVGSERSTHGFCRHLWRKSPNHWRSQDKAPCLSSSPPKDESCTKSTMGEGLTEGSADCKTQA